MEKYIRDINSYLINTFGSSSYKSMIVNILFSFLLLFIIIKLRKTKYYGLTKVKDTKKYLYFVPLILISSVNLWVD